MTTNIYNMADTWNAGATTFTAIKMNVTDTASAAGSMLLDLQVDGSSVMSVVVDDGAGFPYVASIGSTPVTGSYYYFGPAAGNGNLGDFLGGFYADGRYADGTLATAGSFSWNAVTATVGSYNSEFLFSWSASNALVYCVGRGAAFQPLVSDTIALGTTSTTWSDLFLASGGVINFNNGDMTLTHSSNKLTISGDTYPGNRLEWSQDEGYTDWSSLNINYGCGGGAYITWVAGPGTSALYDFLGGITGFARNDAGGQVLGFWFDAQVKDPAAATFSSAAEILWKYNAADKRLHMEGSAITCYSNDALALGTSSVGWSDLFLASGGVINWAAGDYTLTHSAGTLFFSDNVRFLKDDGSGSPVITMIGNSPAASGYFTFNPAEGTGAANDFLGGFFADARTSTGDGAAGGGVQWNTVDPTNGAYSSNLIFYWSTNDAIKFVYGEGNALYPDGSDSLALGTTSKMWSDLFLASGSVINFNAGDVTLTHSTDKLTVAGGQVTFAATTTSYAAFNLPTGSAPTSPVDGDVWREDNTNTGLKIRINGVTKTITVA